MEKLIYEGPEGEILRMDEFTPSVFSAIAPSNRCPILFSSEEEALDYLKTEFEKSEELPSKFHIEYVELHGEDIGRVMKKDNEFLAICYLTHSTELFTSISEGAKWIMYNCWAAKLEEDMVTDPIFFEGEV